MASKKKIRRKSIPWWHNSWDRIVFLFILAIFMLMYPGQNVYMVHMGFGELNKKRVSISVPYPSDYPVNVSGISPGSEISAEGIIVYDINSGVYLYKRNAEESLSPASTTKIMTALVALDAYSLDDVVTVPGASVSGQLMGLVPGETITVENLLYGALVQSGNDAAMALASHYQGGVDKFVEMMNQKAGGLHLEHTHFTNPVGFYDPDHYMTPIDLTRLAAAALQNNTIAKMVAIPQITVSDVTHSYFHDLKNVNQLLGKIPGVGGIKTGWTEESGENLVTLVERNGHRIITVVLRSKDRFDDTTKLINWVFGNVEWQDFNKNKS